MPKKGEYGTDKIQLTKEATETNALVVRDGRWYEFKAGKFAFAWKNVPHVRANLANLPVHNFCSFRPWPFRNVKNGKN